MNINNSRKIVVTGGAGMIGSAIVWTLNNQGIDNILIVDRLGTDEKWKNLLPLQYGDYMDADEFLDVVRNKPDNLGNLGAIFHLGACSSTTETDASYLMRNNFGYTKELANFAVARRVRFLYASSAATYGDGSAGMSDSLEDLHVLRPLNMYGYSKHLFDCYAAQRGIARGIIGLKYFNVFGPNENHKADMRSVVYKALQQIKETGRMSLFKSYKPEFKHGEQQRDFLYVKDAAAMTVHLAGLPLAGGLFNIGSGRASSWLELAHAIFAAIGRKPEIEFVDMPQAMRDKYQYFTQADMGKFQATAYPRPLTSLNVAVADYVRNYLIPGLHLGDEEWTEEEAPLLARSKIPQPKR